MQRIRVGPPALQHSGSLQRQPLAEVAPVITTGLGQQLRRVGAQCLVEQPAAVEGMLAQHAVAPAMDGGNGRFIHPLCGQLQGMCPLGPLGGRIGITQTLQERIGLWQHGKDFPGRGGVHHRAPANDILIRNAPRDHDIQTCSRLDGFGTGPEECRGLGQPRPDAVTQFQRGRFGEGHHQDLRRGQRFAERRGRLGQSGLI